MKQRLAVFGNSSTVMSRWIPTSNEVKTRNTAKNSLCILNHPYNFVHQSFFEFLPDARHQAGCLDTEVKVCCSVGTKRNCNLTFYILM